MRFGWLDEIDAARRPLSSSIPSPIYSYPSPTICQPIASLPAYLPNPPAIMQLCNADGSLKNRSVCCVIALHRECGGHFASSSWQLRCPSARFCTGTDTGCNTAHHFRKLSWRREKEPRHFLSRKSNTSVSSLF